jgi:hypothetical protein
VAKLNDRMYAACGTIRDRDDAIALVSNILDDERARCERIINAARCGEIDGDLRCIKSRIMGGDDFPEIKGE